ncbi:MAG: alpha/beta fold hydrolase, partial [Thermovirgaceae bacterium]
MARTRKPSVDDVTPGVPERKGRTWPFPRATAFLLVLLLFVAKNTAAGQSREDWPHVAFSEDGTPISWETHGEGEPALVFVHGWSCDARYWKKQVPVFSKTRRVITMDLAGHGHSGMNRKQYTMASFGEDVRAVVEAAAAVKVILVGHSMGGSVIAEAAKIMPEQVIGLIGVDTLENVGYRMSSEEAKMMVAPFEQDFPSATKEFVSGMIQKDTDTELRHWIVSDMASAPPTVAVSAMKEMV